MFSSPATCAIVSRADLPSAESLSSLTPQRSRIADNRFASMNTEALTLVIGYNSEQLHTQIRKKNINIVMILRMGLGMGALYGHKPCLH